MKYLLRTFPYVENLDEVAAGCQRDEWDGLLFDDIPLLLPDAYVAVERALARTENISIGTAVTNLVNRHPSVVAGAAATWQQMCPGRVMLGVGRGDTSLSLAGLTTPSVSQFEQLLKDLTELLGGQSVHSDHHRLAWTDPDCPQPHISVYASGPKVLGVGGRWGDSVTVTVGADPERISWAAQTARQAAQDAGRTIEVGAYVVVGVDGPDSAGIDLVRGQASISAHFQGGTLARYSSSDQELIRSVIDSYDPTRHSTGASPQAQQLTTEFLRQFVVVGDAEQCGRHLQRILDTGLDFLVIVGADRSVPTEERLDHDHRIAVDVIHPLREGAPVRSQPES